MVVVNTGVGRGENGVVLLEGEFIEDEVLFFMCKLENGCTIGSTTVTLMSSDFDRDMSGADVALVLDLRTRSEGRLTSLLKSRTSEVFVSISTFRLSSGLVETFSSTTFFPESLTGVFLLVFLEEPFIF